MRIALLIVAIGVPLACVAPPPVDVPLCTADDVGREPARACTETPEFDAYYVALGSELADGLRHRYPQGIPLRVSFDSEAAVDSICAGDARSEPPLNARKRAGRNFSALRKIEGAPRCLAGASLNLESEIERQNLEFERTRKVFDSLASCAMLRGRICTEAHDPVCAVYPDGGTRTYANACEACSDSFVKGYSAGSCGPR